MTEKEAFEILDRDCVLPAPKSPWRVPKPPGVLIIVKASHQALQVNLAYARLSELTFFAHAVEIKNGKIALHYGMRFKATSADTVLSTTQMWGELPIDWVTSIQVV